MQPLTETRRIQTQLKALLKQRGFSYRCLAGELGISVPTVKRTFSGADMTLSRLSKICGSLGVEVHEVLAVAQTDDKDLHMLSAEHEEFFAEHPHYLHYLLTIYNMKMTPAELEKACLLSKRSTHRYLKRLTEMKLIKVLTNGSIRYLFSGLIGWREDGPLGSAVSSKKIQSLATRAMMRKSPDLFIELSGRRLTDKQYAEMKADFQEVVMKYRRISKANSARLLPLEVGHYETMIIGDRSHNRYAEIRELT